MTKDFELIGLAGVEEIKGHLKSPSDPDSFFVAKFSDQIDKKGLWNYCKNNWRDRKIATISFDKTNSAGVPIDAIINCIAEL